MRDYIQKIVKEEFKKIFEDVYTAPLHGGTTEGELQYYPYGYEGFDDTDISNEYRYEIATNTFNELKKQFNGDEKKAIENMPSYMLLFL